MNLTGILTNYSKILPRLLTPETGPTSPSGDTPDGVSNVSDSPPSLRSPSKKKESKEKDSSESASFSPSKNSSSPSSSEKIQMLLPPFPHRLRNKDQDHVEKMRETFSQFLDQHSLTLCYSVDASLC